MFDLSGSCGMVATRHNKKTSGTSRHALCSGQLLRSAAVFPGQVGKNNTGYRFVKAAIEGECGARQKHILVGGDEPGHAQPIKTPKKVARKDSGRCCLHGLLMACLCANHVQGRVDVYQCTVMKTRYSHSIHTLTYGMRTRTRGAHTIHVNWSHKQHFVCTA